MFLFGGIRIFITIILMKGHYIIHFEAPNFFFYHVRYFKWIWTVSVDHQDWLSRTGPLRGHSSQLKSFQFTPYINSFRPPHYWLIIINYSTDWSPKAAAQLFVHHLFNSNLSLLHLVAIIMPLYSWLSELETSEHWQTRGW